MNIYLLNILLRVNIYHNEKINKLSNQHLVILVENIYFFEVLCLLHFSREVIHLIFHYFKYLFNIYFNLLLIKFCNLFLFKRSNNNISSLLNFIKGKFELPPYPLVSVVFR